MKINGSLVFDASSASEIQNLRIQKVAANPTFGSADVGRAIFNTTDGTLYVGVGSPISNWVAIATGGNAAALQTELDTTQTSLGSVINANGSYNAAALTESAFGTHTSLTQALANLAAAVNTNDALAQLSDVTLTSPASGQYLRYNGTVWVNDTFTLSDIAEITVPVAQLNLLTGLTAEASELNKLDGATVSTADLNLISGFAAGLAGLPGTPVISFTEFSHLDGVTSNIQTQLDNKQPLDATLTAAAALDGLGIVVQTADGATPAFTHRSLTAPAAGLTITNPAGTLGNPTFALANDLAALEGLATTGYIVRTGDGTATTRTFAVTAGELVVTNGDGVASDTTFGLATVTDGGTGTFLKLTRDVFGRVSGTTAVVTADITALVDATYVNITGDTMTGNLNMGGAGGPFTVTGLAAPVAASDATPKSYVDSLVAGLSWEAPILAIYATQAALDAAVATPVSGARYALTDMPARIVQWNGSAYVAENLVDGAAFFNSTDDIGYTYNGTAVVPFSGAASFVAGDGLVMSGNTVNINFGAGIAQLPSDEVGIDLTSPTSGGLRLRLAGVDSTDTGATLSLVLKSAGGLTQDVDGLYIPADGVTNAMLLNDAVTVNGDTGTGSLALGGILEVRGTSTAGISTSVNGTGVFTVTAADASATQKGVATFNTGDFAVAAGDVTIKTAGVDNAQLVNSVITFAGTTGNDQVALGETVTFSSTVAGLVSSTVATNGVALDIRLASASDTGVASFDAAHFSVATGVVSLAATIDDLTNVSGADAASTGEILTKSATDWVPVSRADLVGSTSVADHNDVTVTSVNDGEMLVRSGTQWVNRKTYHLHDQTTADTTWTVTHGLNQRYCNVTIVDDTHEVVIPQSITFDSATQLTVTFNTNVSGKVVVMGVNVA